MRISFAVLALASILLSACSRPDPAEAWWQTVAMDVGAKLGGCAVGDLDLAHPGNEIAVVVSDGRVSCTRRVIVAGRNADQQ